MDSALPAMGFPLSFPAMQKAFPLILVLILAGFATVFSLREKPAPKAPPAVPVAESPGKPIPPAGQAVETQKTDTAGKAPIPRAWPQAASDIPADANAKTGALANGFRYVIYPNAEPPKRVSLRLHIRAGSLMEADDQQGIAHFLEHMVFNGTKHYSPDELIPKMQRLGIAFGAHANAYTAFDETVYMLDLPDLSDGTMDLAFTVMRDFADGALLDAAEIDKERGVILSEKMSRDSVQYRIMEQQFAELFPDALLKNRFPIGIEEVISKASRERFLDLYTRYYTPERMTFVVAGDIDPAVLEKRIAEVFGSMTNPQNPGGEPVLGKVTPAEGIEPAVFADAELTSSDVSLTVIRPFVKKPDTRATRGERMPLSLAHAILDRRFERIAKEKGSPLASASASRSDLFNFAETGSIDATAADDRWKEIVPIIEQEFRRAMRFGFTEAEIAEAKSNTLNFYEQAVKQKSTRRSEGIAIALVNTINDDKVFSTPETNLEIAKAQLEGITAESCHEAFKKFWDAPGYHLILTTKEKPENGERELAALFEESRGKEVAAPETRASIPFGYENFGKPGTVRTTNEVSDLGIKQLVFSNNVRVNLKRTEFEKNKIRLLARIGSGQLGQPAGSPMLQVFADSIMEGGGLGKHSNDELRQILAGKNASSSFSIGEDAFTLTGTTTPGDFPLQCRLMCASLTDPGYREEALWQFQKTIPMLYQSLRHTAAGPQGELESWLHGGDFRYTIAPQEKLGAYTIADVKKWLGPQLGNGYLELSIVGDFEEEKILPELLATFGAIPPRDQNPAAAGQARKVDFPNAPAMKELTYESKIPQGIAVALWKTDGMRGNQQEVRRLNILSEILGDRMREEIREKLGASYSPNAAVDGSEVLEGYGMIIGNSIGKPADIERLLETMRSEADALAEKGATADDLDRALKPALGMLAKSLRDNGYWLSTVLSQSQTDPVRLELARNRDKDYASITLDEINALAKKYLAGANAILVTIKPKE